MSWEINRNVFSAKDPDGRSEALVTLTNLRHESLPASGWAIYFTCVAEVVTGQLEQHLVLEQVSGTLFRLRPLAGFRALPSGSSVQITFFHPEILTNTTNAPSGPYFVSDNQPEAGLAIHDYHVLPLVRPEQLDKGANDPVSVISAQEIFKQNAIILDLPAEQLPPVFPVPAYFENRPGTLYWTSMPEIIAAAGLKQEVLFATTLLRAQFPSGSIDEHQPALHLAIAQIDNQTSPEAYRLEIDPVGGVKLTGNSDAGVLRGLESLRQLWKPLSEQKTGLKLQAMEIIDAPRFGYRGLMLDVARNFQTKETVIRLLDLMARYKLNKFHFHLADDEGWRLAISGIPELTAYGSQRGQTLSMKDHLQPAFGSGPDAGNLHGSGFYSRADYIEIVQHAASLHIEVIPEIEMPGHSRAAVKAMEYRYRRLEKSGDRKARHYLLNDPDDHSIYRSAQLYSDNVMNPGMPSTYAFIEHVISELVALHRQAGAPLSTIHVGGDELPAGAWGQSPACLKLMQRMKINSNAGVWDYFYTHVDQILHRHGVFASGWEELGTHKQTLNNEGKLVPNQLFTHNGFNLYVWNNLGESEDLAYRLANAGYNTVLAPATKLYFDMAVNKNPDELGVNWAGYSDLDTVYDFIPLDDIRINRINPAGKPGSARLTDFGQTHIIGMEGVLFSEAMHDAARIDHMIMPRMLALAERAWAKDPAWTSQQNPEEAAHLHKLAWSQFVNQLGKQVLPQLDSEQNVVKYRIPAPGLKVENGVVLANIELPGFTLRFTTDGSEPDMNSPVMTAPIPFKGMIRVAAFTLRGRKGNSSSVGN